MHYQKQLEKIGSDMDDNLESLQGQIIAMSMQISELQKENKMLVEVTERLHKRLYNLESMEQHI